MSQRDVKQRISSVRNIEKITRAMEMVAAALSLIHISEPTRPY